MNDDINNILEKLKVNFKGKNITFIKMRGIIEKYNVKQKRFGDKKDLYDEVITLEASSFLFKNENPIDKIIKIIDNDILIFHDKHYIFGLLEIKDNMFIRAARFII